MKGVTIVMFTAVVLVLALSSRSAITQQPLASEPVFKNGLRLQKSCASADQFLLGACNAYIMAVHDYNFLAKSWGRPVLSEYCLPDTGDARQMIQTVRQWMDYNPHLLHHGAPSVVTMALVENFPCK